MKVSLVAAMKSSLASSELLLTSSAVTAIRAKVLAFPASSSPLKSILPRASLSAGLAEFLKSSIIGPTFASASVLSTNKTVSLPVPLTCRGAVGVF